MMHCVDCDLINQLPVTDYIVKKNENSALYYRSSLHLGGAFDEPLLDNSDTDWAGNMYIDSEINFWRCVYMQCVTFTPIPIFERVGSTYKKYTCTKTEIAVVVYYANMWHRGLARESMILSAKINRKLPILTSIQTLKTLQIRRIFSMQQSYFQRVLLEMFHKNRRKV